MKSYHRIGLGMMVMAIGCYERADHGAPEWFGLVGVFLQGFGLVLLMLPARGVEGR